MMVEKVGIDLGGHTIVGALVHGSSIVSRRTASTPAGRNMQDVIAAIAELVGALAPSGTPVGVGVPGMLDRQRLHLMRGPNFPGWAGSPLAVLLQEAVKAPVRLENDANCYALGEGTAGCACGLSDFVVFTLGTGIGGGIVSGGRLLLGGHGMGGEIGHICIGGTAPCGCGGRGHLETTAAADGIKREAIEAGLPPDVPKLWEMRAGNTDAAKIWEKALGALATGIASIIPIFDPEAVILGGGMSAAPGLVEELRPRVLPLLSEPYRELLDLRISRLGNDAAVLGAAALWDA